MKQVEYFANASIDKYFKRKLNHKIEAARSSKPLVYDQKIARRNKPEDNILKRTYSLSGEVFYFLHNIRGRGNKSFKNRQRYEMTRICLSVL